MEKFNIEKQLKNIAISLYKIVAEEKQQFVKKYSIIKSQFGTNIQIHIFKNCSGVSVFGLTRFAKEVISEFEKDIQKNSFINLEKIIIPDINNIMIYGGNNQGYVGFTSIVYCDDISQAIKQFEKIGYNKVV